MERYAPTAKDLAGRDVVARSIILEIMEGRGVGPDADHVLLKLDHLGEETVRKRLPGITELSKTFAHVDPTREPIPVVPTCHYMMGGIPTNIHGQALTRDADGNDSVVGGLYAIGEVACVSVHGANRLGGNSLLDLVVFGRAAGIHIEEAMRQGIARRDPRAADVDRAMARLTRWNESADGESVADLKRELQRIMLVNFNVFRNGDNMRKSIGDLADLRERIAKAYCRTRAGCSIRRAWEALELDNLLEVAEATAVVAEARTESRGAHARNDYTQRDDDNWLCHSIYFPGDRSVGSAR